MPFTVALDSPTFDGDPVVADGGAAAAEAGAGWLAEVIASASKPQPSNTIAAATRILRMLPPFVRVQYNT
ncbi:MAG TPA: hypothetical protein VMA96_06730 [Solirubrobacteraceae bacterium]|nr:hypothetical protein [Solirubrobacteraceae bacterium]